MMRILIVLMSLLLTVGLQGQTTWLSAFGAGGQDNAYSLERTFDGSFLVAGSTGSFGNGNSDGYLIKVDTAGQRLWSRYYGGSEIEEIQAVTTASDSGIVMVGHTNGWGNGGYDILMIKTDTAGVQLWDKTYGGPDWEFGMDVVLMPDGGFLITGTTFSYGNGNSDIYLVRTDQNGDTLWTNTVGFNGSEEGNGVDLINGGGAVIGGSTNSTGNGGYDAFLVRVDDVGDTLWTKAFGGMEDEFGHDAIELSNGNLTLVGRTSSFDPDLELMYHLMTDPNGSLVWENASGAPGNAVGNAVMETNAGRIFVAGNNDFWGTGGIDSWLFITDQTGNYISAPTCGGLQDEVIYDLDTTLEGGFMLAGTTLSYGSGQRDVVLIKTDPDGEADCQPAHVVYDPLYINEQTTELPRLKLWPNPASNMVHFDITAYVGKADLSLELFDLTGRSLLIKEIQSSFSSLSVADLGKGSYLVVLKSGAEAISRTIFVKVDP